MCLEDMDPPFLVSLKIWSSDRDLHRQTLAQLRDRLKLQQKVKKNAQVRTIDDGFQFYEALLTLDLSDNMIETIQDGAFQSQVIFIFIEL